MKKAVDLEKSGKACKVISRQGETEFMTYREIGFRALYKQFSAFMITDKIEYNIKDFPGAKQANCILVYGYIDHGAGLTLGVLAAGTKEDKDFRFEKGCEEIRSFIRIGAVDDVEFYHLEDEDGCFQKQFADKLEMLKTYDTSEDIAKTREMYFLDTSRDSYFIDDVLVYLIKDGLDPEGCWVRINGFENQVFMGTLLNEPDQKFGCHAGDEILFSVHGTDGGKVTCCAGY